MLHAFFDDSGADGASDIVLIAGYVASKACWDEAEKLWGAEFGRYLEHGVSWFHMTDVVSRSDQYELIDTPNANHIITQMAKIMGRSGARPIFIGVSRSAFGAVSKSPAFAERFPDPLAFCFEALVTRLVRWSKEEAADEKVSMVYALDEKQVPRTIRNLLAQYHSSDWYSDHLTGIAFGDVRKVYGLQAADMLAHQLSHNLNEADVLSGRTFALDWATSGKSPDGGWCDQDYIQAAIQRFDNSGRI